MAETAGGYRESNPPIPPAKIQRSGRESTRSVDTGVLLAQRMLIATAKLGADGRVFYSEEGTPIQDTETTIEMLWLHATAKNAEHAQSAEKVKRPRKILEQKANRDEIKEDAKCPRNSIMRSAPLAHDVLDGNLNNRRPIP